MIITRTHFRLPLGGGGTDLPSYYSRFGGFFISAAVDRYMFIAINKRFEPGFRISYSKTEIVTDRKLIMHPIVREALGQVGIEGGIEIVSIADAPALSGLGSSGSFAVGLLRALYAYTNDIRTMEDIAEEACDIAMNKLREPSGKQDEYVAAFGGIRCYEVDTSGRVTVKKLKISPDILSELEDNLLLFYTGITRRSSEVLGEQQGRLSKEDGDALERMHAIKRIGLESKAALENEDLSRFGELLHEHWMAKRGVTKSMTNSTIDKWYQIARRHGAIGGKIIGAGGGGFLLLYCENEKKELRSALAHEGLTEHRFIFEPEGSKVVYSD